MRAAENLGRFNVTTQVIGSTDLTATGTNITTTTSTYDRDRLTKTLATRTNTADVTTRYHYDPYGRTSTAFATSTAIPGSPKLIARYTYDGYDRITSQYGYDPATSQATTQTTAFDPLDRPAIRTSNGTETRYRYLGLSKQVDTEQKKNPTNAWANVKAYTYAPNGKPLALVSNNPDGTNTQTRYHSLNPHGDTEALTDPTTGTTKATYRYTAFGNPDPKGTTGDDHPDTNGNPTKDPLNPLQYQAQRINGPFGDYDTGFRTYNPGLNRFLSRDMYTGALADFTLGTDPWNTNRYTFAGGNPISNTDLTGHMVDFKPMDSGYCKACIDQTVGTDVGSAVTGVTRAAVTSVAGAAKDQVTQTVDDFKQVPGATESFFTGIGLGLYAGNSTSPPAAKTMMANEGSDRINRGTRGLVPALIDTLAIATMFAGGGEASFAARAGSRLLVRESGFPAAETAAASRGLSSVGNQNVRVLRNWANSKGWVRQAGEGPEVWGIRGTDGSFSWRLKIKPDASTRPGLEAGSKVPRFDARLGPGQYVNPFTGEVGGRPAGTHIPLEYQWIP